MWTHTRTLTLINLRVTGDFRLPDLFSGSGYTRRASGSGRKSVLHVRAFYVREGTWIVGLLVTLLSGVPLALEFFRDLASIDNVAVATV